MNIMLSKNKFLEFFKTLKSSDETLTFKVSDSLEDARAKLSARIPFLKEKSISDALRNLPDSKIETLGTTEEEWMQQAQKIVDDVHKSVGQNISELKKVIKLISQKLKSFDLKDRENKARNVNQAQENLDIASAKGESEAEAHRLDEEINQLEIDRADVTEEILEKKNKNGNRPMKSLLHSKMFYLGIMTILGLLELPINFFSALAFGEASDFLNMIFCVGFAIVICISAHYTGEGVAYKNKVEVGGGFLVAVFTIVTILFIRHSIGYAVALGLFNVALFLAGSLLSYSRAKDLGYFENDSDLEQISQELITKKKDRKLTHKVLAKDLADIEFRYKELAQKEAWAEIEELNTQLKNSEIEYEKLTTYLKGYELSIQSLFEEGINVYRSTNNLHRFRKFPEVKYWNRKKSIPSLSFNYLKKKDLKKKAKMPKGVSLLIPILGVLVLSSCAPNTAKDLQSEVRVLLDKTDDFPIDEEATIKHIEEDIGFHSGNVDNGIKVTFSTITSNTFNPVYQVEMERGKSFFQGSKSSDRIKQREFFQDSLRSAFQTVLDEPVGRKESEIYASICSSLHELKASSSKKKKLIILSDLLEHTPVISFYAYRDNTEAFKNNWNRIEEILEQNCSIPDLEGIDIQVIHLPDESTDHLFIMVLDFWKLFFEEHGAASFTHYPNV